MGYTHTSTQFVRHGSAPVIHPEEEIRIYRFFSEDLALTAAEAIVYGVIFRSSEDEEHYFTGTRGYISCWCNRDQHDIRRLLNSLVERGLILKESLGSGTGAVARYRVNPDRIPDKYRRTAVRGTEEALKKASYSPYFVIKGWMAPETGLTGFALELFALIYGETHEGGWYQAPATVMGEMTGAGKLCVYKNMSRLCKKGLLEKESYWIGSKVRPTKHCRYRSCYVRRPEEYSEGKNKVFEYVLGGAAAQIPEGRIARERETGPEKHEMPDWEEHHGKKKKSGRGKRKWKKEKPENDDEYLAMVRDAIAIRTDAVHVAKAVGSQETVDAAIDVMALIYTGRRLPDKKGMLPAGCIKERIEHADRPGLQALLGKIARWFNDGLIRNIRSYLADVFMFGRTWAHGDKRSCWKAENTGKTERNMSERMEPCLSS